MLLFFVLKKNEWLKREWQNNSVCGIFRNLCYQNDTLSFVFSRKRYPKDVLNRMSQVFYNIYTNSCNRNFLFFNIMDAPYLS